jgi:hypothetical protein
VADAILTRRPRSAHELAVFNPETCMSDSATRSASGDLDLSRWPVARYRMPERVLDAEAETRIAEFDALIARGERFVLVF